MLFHIYTYLTKIPNSSILSCGKGDNFGNKGKRKIQIKSMEKGINCNLSDYIAVRYR